MTARMVESTLAPAAAVLNEVVPAGEPWMGTVRKGQIFRILDLEGNQAVDTLFYNAVDSEERYSASNTIRAQANLYLTSGTRLLSNRGNVMLDIVADTCGRHDTLGGACSAESNTVRYAIEKRHMHSCRDNFLTALARSDFGIPNETSRATSFLHERAGHSGGTAYVRGWHFGARRYVEMQAAMDVMVLISNCPQLNNPCNAYNPTPIRLMVWNLRSLSDQRSPTAAAPDRQLSAILSVT